MFIQKNRNLNKLKMLMKVEIKNQKTQMCLIEQADYQLVKMKVQFKVQELIKQMKQKKIKKKVFDI